MVCGGWGGGRTGGGAAAGVPGEGGSLEAQLEAKREMTMVVCSQTCPSSHRSVAAIRVKGRRGPSPAPLLPSPLGSRWEAQPRQLHRGR